MTTGTAYAFFNCTASKSEIEAELPTIRAMAQTPSQLELTLTEGVENLLIPALVVDGVHIQTSPEELQFLRILDNAKQAGIRYVMQAQLPGATNKQTEDELATIINQAYQSPLYQPGEPFSGEIVHYNGKEFAFRD